MGFEFMANREQTAASIHPLAADKYRRWLPLWKSYQAFYQANLPADVTEESWRRMVDPIEPTFGALAFAGDEAVGLVHWIFHPFELVDR